MQESCAKFEITMIEVDYDEKTMPLGDRDTWYTRCIPCDVLPHNIIAMNEKLFFKQMAGKEREKGRVHSLWRKM